MVCHRLHTQHLVDPQTRAQTLYQLVTTVALTHILQQQTARNTVVRLGLQGA